VGSDDRVAVRAASAHDNAVGITLLNKAAAETGRQALDLRQARDRLTCHHRTTKRTAAQVSSLAPTGLIQPAVRTTPKIVVRS
jgi:hypothetical protein